jgi:Protein of unknown function
MRDLQDEKVTFGRQDIPSLHHFPSANCENALLVKTPGRSGLVYLLARVIMFIVVAATVCVAGAIFIIERGYADGPLASRGQKALDTALGPSFSAKVGSTVLRLADGGKLALEAMDLTLQNAEHSQMLLTAGSARFVLNPIAMLTGQIKVSAIELSNIVVDAGVLPKSEPVDLSKVELGQMRSYVEQLFTQIDEIAALGKESNTDSILITDSHFVFDGPKGGKINLVIDTLELSRDKVNGLVIAGSMRLGNKPLAVAMKVTMDGDTSTHMDLSVNNLDFSRMFINQNLRGVDWEGFAGAFDIAASVARQTPETPPELSLTLGTERSNLLMDGVYQPVDTAIVPLSFDFARNRIEIDQAELKFGNTKIPISGAIMDMEPEPDGTHAGFLVDLLAKDGIGAPAKSGEDPLPFDAKATGRFLFAQNELIFDQMVVSSAAGSMAGSLAVRFGESSPEISFAADAPKLEMRAIKQLWPFWIARKARTWALANLYGGTVTNASVAAFIPQGRMAKDPEHLDLNENELKLSMDTQDLRMNLPDELPPLRDIAGHLVMNGGNLQVRIDKGTGYMKSGRIVQVRSANFSIPHTYVKPLMGDLDILLDGPADALAELLTYKPIQALQRTPFVAEDFSGNANAAIKATFGLVKEQAPPEPVWQANVTLDKVDLTKPYAGRKITNAKGSLAIIPDHASLDIVADIDGVALSVKLVEPLAKDSATPREQLISGTLNGDQIKTLVPGLNGIVDGTLGLKMSRIDEDEEAVEVDLGSANITIPWVKWTKGSGVAANAKFHMKTSGDTISVSEFALGGDGFGANGKLEINKTGLVAADFRSMKLSPEDNFGLSLRQKKGSVSIKVNGTVADLRPVLGMIKQSSSSEKSDGGQFALDIDLDKAIGFNNETVKSLKSVISGNGDDIEVFNLSAVSANGQAIVGRIIPSGDSRRLELTAGDAGALARFADIYKNMRGGLLNLRLTSNGAKTWAGAVDIRTFSLVEENRLQTIVSTPAGEEGRSLNQAVKRDIDVSSEKFARGYAELLIRDGVVQIGNGVVRGEQVGATFQGTVRDKNGQTDMTGTFMPAYGLNRLFAELPIIGLILGNGRDRGLLGITFKLTGDIDKPKLTVNPLSIIAPGVFRSIFEFQ